MAWSKYKDIRYALAGIPSANLTDIADLVAIVADADIASELSGGGGVKFTNGDGTVDLPFALLAGSNLAAGTVYGLMKNTLLTAASVGDGKARIYYSSGESTTEDRAGAVSGGYAAFYVLDTDPSGSAPQLIDLTSGDNGLSSGGSMTGGDLVSTGPFGKAWDFDGSDDEANKTSGLSGVGTGPRTIEAVVWSDESGSTARLAAEAYAGDASFAGVGQRNGNVAMVFGNAGYRDSATTMPTGEWASLGLRYSSSFSGDSYLDLNGSIVDTRAMTGDPAAVPERLYVGRWRYGDWWLGKIAAVRISNVLRSENWRAYAAVNDIDNADTFTLSAEQGGGGGGGANRRRRLICGAAA